ncbi:hypothetical protein ACWC3Y_10880 [Streptomyces sp. NPDC001296]
MPDEQEPAYRCTHCPRLLHANELGRPACFVCEDRATEQLQAFPDRGEDKGLYTQLAAVLAPGKSGGTAGRAPASRTAPLPTSLEALDLRGPGGIVPKLLGVEQRWRAWNGFQRLPFRGNYEQTLPKCVEFIVNNLPWACAEYPYVSVDLKTIGSLHHRADTAVKGEREQKVPIGLCPVSHEDTGAPCGERLKVSPWALSIRCSGCGTKWGRDEWLRLGAAIRGLPVPATLAGSVSAA